MPALLCGSFNDDRCRIQDSRREAATTPVNPEGIIEDIEGNIRKYGADWNEWCVATAKDSPGPFFRRHPAADWGEGLAYRQAYTTVAAPAVVERLVKIRGLQLHVPAGRFLKVASFSH